METLILKRKNIFSPGDTGTHASPALLRSGMTLGDEGIPSKESLKNYCHAGQQVRLTSASSGTPQGKTNTAVYKTISGHSSRVFLFLFFCLFAFTTYSQNQASSAVSWSVTKTFDAGKGITNETAAALNISSSKIDWLDAKGKLVKSFTVVEVKGTWSDMNQPGEIAYILGNESSGVLSVSRTDQETIASLVLTSETETTSIDFYLDSFTLLN